MGTQFINANFYDIESLSNLFTLANLHDSPVPEQMSIDLYYLFDDFEMLLSIKDWQAQVLDKIYQVNENFKGSVRFLNLHAEDANVHLARTFGLSNARYANDPLAKNNYRNEFRLVCDTDEQYREDQHPYLMGYNSFNYDTTMLAWYQHEVWTPAYQGTKQDDPEETCKFEPISAGKMRQFNDKLFGQYKNQMPSALADTDQGPSYTTNVWMIRKNMLMSGRHLDVARLNEKQEKVALKRLLGMLGYQIKEPENAASLSKATSVQSFEQFCDLIAYNISDIVNLRQLFYHPFYQAQFELKKGLLESFPELIYQKQSQSYKPDISSQSVRPDRLNIDSSSAQLAEKALCPYGHLTDIETVSFWYPAEEQAKELGIPRVNVLEESKKFFYDLFPQQELRDQFDRVYRFYKTIEGKNFNNSEGYRQDWLAKHSEDGEPDINALCDIPKSENTCLPYFDRNGNPTSCFVQFSTGGIHGAEYNLPLFQKHTEEYKALQQDMKEAMRQFPNPVDLRKARQITMPDGRVLPYSVFLKGGLKIADSQYRDIESKKPQLFVQSKSKGKTKKGRSEKGWSLNKKYSYTSAGSMNHEDFESYYPNLLRRMMAFFNPGLGYDRYAEIFNQKQTYGKYMKDANRSAEERNHYRVLREGTKLVLNAASGAADAPFENNIRVNNQIISMRIIGQLFSWRIGQAQTYEGALIPSTNTDGLYSVMEESENNRILAREAASIGVNIEPEPLYLISKDTNNRIELDQSENVTGASGGSVSCREGPNPTKSLAHAAIIDWALTEYLIVASKGYKDLSLQKPFNRDIGRNILHAAFSRFDTTKLLLMFQTIIASSPSTLSYVYGLRESSDPIVLQHYNRMFFMREQTEETMHLWAAAAKIITPLTRAGRIRRQEREVAVPDEIAYQVLRANGESCDYIDRDIVTKRVTNIDPEAHALIENRDLYLLSEQRKQEIIQGLSIEDYLNRLCTEYENNWMNKAPGSNDENQETEVDMICGEESDEGAV